jgi:short-subunit dehydrogenase
MAISPNPMEPMGLALVTGASSGIGRALAAELVERGYDVVVAAEDDAIRDCATTLTEQTGRVAVAVQVDLSRAAQVEELYREVTELGRPLDVLCLNAGVGVGGRFPETDLEADLRLVDLNVRSVVHLAKLVIRDMVRRGEGRVLVTSSIAATAPGPFHATYAASKAFDHSFAEAIRTELKDTGVTVTSLMPGPTDTEIFDRAGMQDTRVAQGPKDDPADVARDGLDALFAGRDSVVAGSLRNRIQAEVATHLPDKVAAPAMGTMTKPQSGQG